jgi:arylsulfatase A-like enzyme
MTDQQRADALGCSGGWLNTPNLDRIAAGGVRFANCITNSPVCIPARLSLATGLYPHNTGVWNNQRSQPGCSGCATPAIAPASLARPTCTRTMAICAIASSL